MIDKDKNIWNTINKYFLMKKNFVLKSNQEFVKHVHISIRTLNVLINKILKIHIFISQLIIIYTSIKVLHRSISR
jgi:hypothetical protein